MTPPRGDESCGAAARYSDAPSRRPMSAALLARARHARQLRATMSTVLPRDLLVDPAWDMMLDLFVAAGTGERLCVKDLRLMSGESAAGAMRRIDRLQESGLIARHPDPNDHRRVHVALTERGQMAMAAMLEHLFETPDGTGQDAAATPRSFHPGPVRGQG